MLGRPKGSKNRQKQTLSMFAKSIGYDPIVELVNIRKNKNCTEDRKVQIAQSLLPYLHPKLTAVTVSGDVDSPLIIKIVQFKAKDAT